MSELKVNAGLSPYQRLWYTNKDIFVDFFYIGFVSPVLIYIGIQRAGSPEWLFQGLLAIAGVIMAYHLYFGYSNYKKGSSTLWLNAFHFLIVAPVLLWIGYYGKETTRYAFELVLLLGFGSLGYHIYSLVLKTLTVTGGKTEF